MPCALLLAACLAACAPTTAAATRYVAPGGSDASSCKSPSAPCRTIGRAFHVASAGEVVKVAAGSYGEQTISGAKAPPGVVIKLAPGAHFDEVTVHATWVELRGGRIDDYGWWREAVDPVPSHVTFRNVAARSVSINGGDRISIVGGSIGGYTAPAGQSAAVFLYGDARPLSNVLISGVDVHDITHAVPDDHFETVRIDKGAHDVAIRDSRFRNVTASTSTIFITNTDGGGGDPYDLAFENNFFSDPALGAGGGAYYVINMNGVVGTCKNFAFRYNSFVSSAASLQCATKSNVSWIGNVAPKPPGCEGNTFSHNVWQWTRPSTCSRSDTWVRGPQYSPSRLGYVDPSAGDLHLRAASPARDAGDSASHPRGDIDCGRRSRGAAPDAGADEFGSNGSCAPRPRMTKRR